MSTLFIDSSYIAYSKMFVCRREETAEEGFGLWRFYYINDIFKYIKQFEDVTEVVVARDSKANWRRNIFPWYKKHRKVTRNADEAKAKAEDHWFTWQEFYDYQEEFINVMKKYVPVKVLEVNTAEADDIIAVLCQRIKGKKFVVTTDHDYIQLLQNDDVKIFSPMKKAYLHDDNPKHHMLVKVMAGDKSDFIPSIGVKYTFKPEFLRYCVMEGLAENEKFAQVKMENDDTLLYDWYFKYLNQYGVSPARAKNFTEKMAKHHISEESVKELLESDEKLKEDFKRNNKLVNLTAQPKAIKKKIIDQYENYELPKTNLLKFCKENKFRHFMEHISEFSELLKPLKG